MATVHTTARGTEPYDKVYCLGYQVHHEGLVALPPHQQAAPDFSGPWL